MSVPIKAGLEKVPGGMMLVPFAVGTIIHTAAPGSGEYFGSFTGAFFVGLPALLAVFFFAMGSTLEVRSTPYLLKKGGVLLGSKVAFALVVGLIAGQLLGEDPVSGGLFAGLSALALVAALSDTNGAMYLSLMGQYGRARDAGAYSLMSIESGPFLTMVILGAAGLSAFPWQALVGAILPLLLGMLVGNLDPDMRTMLKPLVPGMVPFLGLALGLTVDLGTVVDAGLLGVALGVFVVFVGGAVLLLADKLTGGDGVAGLAAATTAGNAAVVPAVVASVNPVYAPAAEQATVLVAACVVVTAILCPMVTAGWARRVGRDSGSSEAPPSEAIASTSGVAA
jgi:2-keto-3-deoxygluconate permease